ncbi:unnamed protein product, partial [Closterium sp. NIES-54]
PRAALWGPCAAPAALRVAPAALLAAPAASRAAPAALLAAPSRPRAAPAALVPPLQPGALPLLPSSPLLQPRAPPLAARPEPLHPASRPGCPACRPLRPALRPYSPRAALCSPLAAPATQRPACFSLRCSAPARLAYFAAMASLRVLEFDHEGCLIQFDTWLDDLQLYLLSDSSDSVSLFDHTSGAAPAPPATADSATRSQWLTRDAAARLAIRNHLPLTECAHFGQHSTAHALDHFLALDPTALTVDLLTQHLLADETSVVAVGAARGTPRTPFSEGCSPSPLAPSYASAAAVDVLGAEDVGAASTSGKRRNSKGKGGRGGGSGSGGGGGGSSGGGGGSGGGGSGGSGGGSGGFGGGSGGSSGSGGSGGSGSCGGRAGAAQRGDSGVGERQQQQRWSETPSPQQVREWFSQCGASGVERRQRAAPHSSSFPPTTAPLQTLHMDVWGPARVSGQGRERYFLLVVDDYTRYTTVFPLRSKGEVPDVLIPWIRTVRLQLHERFRQDLPLMRLHSDRGGEFSSDLLRDFFHGEGILQSFTLPASPQQNGIAERRVGLVMEVACTSMVHAAAPHFLWPFAVRYAAHQLNLWPRVSLRETSPTLRWTGKVGDASEFQVRGSRAFVRDTSADKLSARAIPCGPAPSGVSQVDPPLGTVPGKVAVDSGAARGAAFGGAETGGAEPGGAEPWGAEPVGVESGGAEPWSADSGGAKPGGAEPRDAESGGAKPGGGESWGAEPGGAESGGVEPGGAEPRGPTSFRRSCGCLATEPPSPQQLRERFTRCTRLRSAAVGAGGSTAGDTRARGAGGARTGGTGAAKASGAGVAGAGGAGASGAGAGGPRASGLGGAGAAAAGGTGAAGAGGAAGVGVGGAGPGGAGAGFGDNGRPRLYFVPLLQQVLGLPSSPSLPPPFLCPPPDQSQLPLQPASPLPTPSPYTEKTGGLTERHEPESRPSSCVRAVRTGRRVPRPRPAPVLGTHVMALHPSSVPLHVPLLESSLPIVPDPANDLARAASPTISRLLAIVVTNPSFESTAASALVAELVEFAATCRVDYATALVAESMSPSPPSVGGECALGTDVLEDRQEDFECLAAAVPRFASMLLAPEGDPDAPDIPTPRSYAEAITGPCSSKWHVGIDAEMASWMSTGTYVDAVPPSWANIVDGMWIFRVKRPSGSPPAFKARYVARGFSQRQGVDYFQTFSPTPKMATHWVLLHVAAQRDYELHSLDFSTAFLQGSLHEEIRLRRPPGFTGSFPAITQWSLQRPVYGLRQAPHEWHDTLRTTLAALGFTPSTANPSSCEAEIYAGAMAAREPRWLTYLLSDLGEQPRSPPVLYVDNKAMTALCQEHRTKHIALRYLLARELQQRGQLHLACVATRANIADIFTKALPPGDHQRFSIVLGLVPTLPHLLTA